jgi:hypothetical protein
MCAGFGVTRGVRLTQKSRVGRATSPKPGAAGPAGGERRHITHGLSVHVTGSHDASLVLHHILEPSKYSGAQDKPHGGTSGHERQGAEVPESHRHHGSHSQYSGDEVRYHIGQHAQHGHGGHADHYGADTLQRGFHLGQMFHVLQHR